MLRISFVHVHSPGFSGLPAGAAVIRAASQSRCDAWLYVRNSGVRGITQKCILSCSSDYMRRRGVHATGRCRIWPGGEALTGSSTPSTRSACCLILRRRYGTFEDGRVAWSQGTAVSFERHLEFHQFSSQFLNYLYSIGVG